MEFILVGVASFAITWGLLRLLQRRRWQIKQLRRQEALADAIDRWHNGADSDLALHEYLGMSRDEYALWLRDPDSIRELKR